MRAITGAIVVLTGAVFVHAAVSRVPAGRESSELMLAGIVVALVGGVICVWVDYEQVVDVR